MGMTEERTPLSLVSLAFDVYRFNRKWIFMRTKGKQKRREWEFSAICKSGVNDDLVPSIPLYMSNKPDSLLCKVVK